MSNRTTTPMQSPAQQSPGESARPWSSFAMMAHGMISEATTIIKEGGLNQPGALARLQQLRVETEAKTKTDE